MTKAVYVVLANFRNGSYYSSALVRATDELACLDASLEHKTYV